LRKVSFPALEFFLPSCAAFHPPDETHATSRRTPPNATPIAPFPWTGESFLGPSFPPGQAFFLRPLVDWLHNSNSLLSYNSLLKLLSFPANYASLVDPFSLGGFRCNSELRLLSPIAPVFSDYPPTSRETLVNEALVSSPKSFDLSTVRSFFPQVEVPNMTDGLARTTAHPCFAFSCFSLNFPPPEGGDPRSRLSFSKTTSPPRPSALDVSSRIKSFFSPRSPFCPLLWGSTRLFLKLYFPSCMGSSTLQVIFNSPFADLLERSLRRPFSGTVRFLNALFDLAGNLAF